MESEPDDTEKKDRRRKWIRSILLLLRDLGVAALIVGIILLSLFLYTGNWPPMVVVESQSMQHSDTESFVGVIDTGDLVLVQNAPSSSDIITYVEGRATGYSTYGEFGDVIIYKQGGDFQAKSIIHRAL
ncbi:MAG: S26 family signal peptidase, partial [Thermoplasmata archaeon]|nr:S26 family signal peptidase [Thermoplasmata archaeon]